VRLTATSYRWTTPAPSSDCCGRSNNTWTERSPREAIEASPTIAEADQKLRGPARVRGNGKFLAGDPVWDGCFGIYMDQDKSSHKVRDP
jgi:hypothetical protein